MKIEIKQELRPCKFVIYNIYQSGLFHCFGNINGQIKAIIENKSGKVFEVEPHNVTFYDNKFKEYIFEEN